MITLAIVDDHPIIRHSLKDFFSLEPDLMVVGEADTASAAFAMVADLEFDVLMLDLVLPGQSGIGVLKKIRAFAPFLKTVVFSGLPEAPYALDVIREGASCYLSKQCPPQELLEAVRVVAGGRRYITPAVAQLMGSQYGRHGILHQQLSDREMEVFLKLAKGQFAHQVAADLRISQKTVATYRYRILEKLRLSSNSAMTSYALSNGLIQ